MNILIKTILFHGESNCYTLTHVHCYIATRSTYVYMYSRLWSRASFHQKYLLHRRFIVVARRIVVVVARRSYYLLHVDLRSTPTPVSRNPGVVNDVVAR